jgi:hypothetical protein
MRNRNNRVLFNCSIRTNYSQNNSQLVHFFISHDFSSLSKLLEATGALHCLKLLRSITCWSSRSHVTFQGQRCTGSLDVLGVHTEQVVRTIDEVHNRVRCRLRLQSGNSRPDRRRLLALLNDVRRQRSATIRRRRQPRQSYR